MIPTPVALSEDRRDYVGDTTTLKIDVDYDFYGNRWRIEWMNTRVAILESLGYELYGGKRCRRTTRGYHFWFTVKGNIDDRTKNKLQFLLGDDVTRVKINNNRIDRGVEEWNKLFSEVYWKQERELDDRCKDCRVRRVEWGLVEDDKGV